MYRIKMKLRSESEKQMVPKGEVIDRIKKALEDLMRL